MANAFDRFIAKLSGTKDGVLPSAQNFPPVDIQQLENELRASVSQPTASTTDLEIRSVIEIHKRKSEEAFRAQLGLYETRIRQARVLSTIAAEIQAEGENALSNLKVQTVDEQNRLHYLSEQVTEHDAEVRRFRDKHGLTRPARIVSDASARFRIALIFLFMAAETILNGVFFAQGSDLGLIGGVVEAAVLAAVNVGSAVLFAAFVIPYIHYHKPIGKLFGVCGLIVYLFWAVSFNVAVANYRDLFASTSGQVLPSVWMRHLVEAPLELASMQSWILGLLGIAFSLATVIDFSGIRDSYPGYGLLARGRREALETYVVSTSDSLAGLQQTRDEAVQGMSNVVRSLKEAQYDLELAIAGRARLLENLRSYHEHLRIAYRQLSKRLRDADAPDTSWLTMPDIPPVPEVSIGETDAVSRKMESLITQVNAHYVEAANQLTTARSALERGAG